MLGYAVKMSSHYGHFPRRIINVKKDEIFRQYKGQRFRGTQNKTVFAIYVHTRAVYNYPTNYKNRNEPRGLHAYNSCRRLYLILYVKNKKKTSDCVAPIARLTLR